MLDKMIDQLEEIFAKNSEEHNRALSIFTVLIHRIRNEVMPDVEKAISKKLRRFLFLPRRLSDEERKTLLRILCLVLLYLALLDIKQVLRDEEEKAKSISGQLAVMFSDTVGVTESDFPDTEVFTSEQLTWMTGKSICEWLDYRDGFFAMEINALCFEKLASIEVHTIKTFCACHKDELYNEVKKIVRLPSQK